MYCDSSLIVSLKLNSVKRCHSLLILVTADVPFLFSNCEILSAGCAISSSEDSLWYQIVGKLTLEQQPDAEAVRYWHVFAFFAVFILAIDVMLLYVYYFLTMLYLIDDRLIAHSCTRCVSVAICGFIIIMLSMTYSRMRGKCQRMSHAALVNLCSGWFSRSCSPKMLRFSKDMQTT